MKLSIAQILSLVAKRGLTDVFAAVMPANLHDSEYSLTQSDVDVVAAKLDLNCEAVAAIGSADLFGDVQTPDTWRAARKAINDTSDDLRQLIKTLDLDTPVVWRD
jgi:hypothetical protein